jgi:outer membrane protein assembly factor BamB
MRCTKVVLSLFAFTVFLAPLAAGDWTHWRGPLQTGVSFDTGLPEKFSLDPKADNSNCVWTAPFGCRSTPVIMNGHVYFIGSFGSGINAGERVVCLNADTGEKVWEDRFNVFHTAIVMNRLGWTSPAGDPDTGNVYVHGTQGHLRCYSKDGKIVWHRNLTEEYGRVSGYGGRIVGPICDGELVIVGMISASWGDYARGANRIAAFDKRTGEVVWWSPLDSPKTYYSTPMVATINGQRLLLTGSADGGLHAIQVRTGKPVWSYHFGGDAINCSPVVEGTYVYCAHGGENDDVGELGRLVCVDAGNVENGKPKLVWEVVGQKFALSSPLVHDGKLYIPSDSARLHGYDAKTGKPLGRRQNGELIAFGRVARGSPVWGDGKIYIFDVNGHFHILKPTENGMKELHDQEFRPKQGGGFIETDGSPAVANGKIYFGTLEAFYCIGTKTGKAGEPPVQPTAKSLGAMAQIQVIPADVVIHPGEKVKFSVHYFDENGEPVGTKDSPKIEWALVTPPKTPAGLQPPPLRGELGDGEFTADKTVPGQQAYISATIGKMTARTRVRVAPVLPYKQDFEKVPVGGTPGGWVNTVGKFDVIEQGGGRVLRKTATSPNPGLARANAYIGLPGYKDYVIQSDASAQHVRGVQPDVGVVNQRYTLLLDGKIDPVTQKRQFRIVTWEALPRINHGIDFDWKPDTWYTMKFVVEVANGKATLKGKVWERDQKEPEKWTIEFTDPMPNTEGCPALYAYISNTDSSPKNPGAECYFDNLSIVPAGAAVPVKPKAAIAQPLAIREVTPGKSGSLSTKPQAKPFAEKTVKEQLADSIRVREGVYYPEYTPPPRRRYVRMSGSLPGAIQVIVGP